MAFGGGTFTNYNKVLPGTYINFVSSASASATVSDRGICAVAAAFSWGEEGKMFYVSAEDFMKDSTKYFGFNYTADSMKGLRDMFLNAKGAYIYRLGTSTKAKCTYANAKYGGVCGNNIIIKISTNIDNEAYYDVVTYYNNVKKDTQSVKAMKDLEDNDYVTWIRTQTLAVTAGVKMTGGADATTTGESYQAFLNEVESVSFNALCAPSTDLTINNLIASFTRRMREDRGVKFQSVLYNCAADDVGIINVDTSASENAAGLVWFVAGACAACPINKSLLNRIYNGSFTISKSYTQAELEACIQSGRFVLHKVDDEYRVLADINSLVTTDFNRGSVFKDNQTIRIIDQIAYDDAILFKTKYLGVVPNDEAGRLSLWSDIVQHRRSLQKMRAIENFNDSDITVEKGDTKTSVVITGNICPINSMAQIYMQITIE